MRGDNGLSQRDATIIGRYFRMDQNPQSLCFQPAADTIQQQGILENPTGQSNRIHIFQPAEIGCNGNDAVDQIKVKAGGQFTGRLTFLQTAKQPIPKGEPAL